MASLTRACLLTTILVAVPIASLVEADEEQTPLLSNPELLARFQAAEVFEYACPSNTLCSVQCSVGDGLEPFEFANVRRFELARSPSHWLLAAVYFDGVGKPHRASGALPVPVSCVMGDLVLNRVSQVDGGDVFRPSQDTDVIFDVQPQ